MQKTHSMMILWLAFLFSFFLPQNPAKAQNVPSKSGRLLIVDPMGKPIEGAVFQLRAFNGNYFVPIGPMEKFAEQYESGPDGFLDFEYPAIIKATDYLTGSIDHPEFLSQEIKFSMAPEATKERTIPLQPGIELNIDLLSEDEDIELQACGVIFSNEGPPLVRRSGNQRLTTKALKAGVYQAMVVQPNSKRLTLFSDPLTFQVKDNQNPISLNTMLEPGVAVQGKIDTQIRRPIQNGKVMALMLVGNAGEGSEQIEWYDDVPIQADGTFDFPSVPRAGKLQLMAMCDGWLSAELTRVGVQGTILEVKNSPIEVELKMNRSFTAKLRFVDSEEKPIQGLFVSCYANQQYITGSNTILGVTRRSIESIEAQIHGRLTDARNVVFPSYGGQSGEDGIVEIRGLPRIERKNTLNLFDSTTNARWIEQFDHPPPDQDIVEVVFKVGKSSATGD